MSYKETKEYKYWNKIRKQANDFWYFDINLSYKERKYFYDLILEATAEISILRLEYGE